MNDKEDLLKNIIIWLIVGVPVTLITLLPTWFVLQGDWNGYLFWIPWAITLSGYFYKLGIIIYPILGITRTKATYILSTVYAVLLGIWGMPLYKRTLIQFVTTPLTGLELQRAILTIVVITTLGVSSSLTMKTSEGLKNDS